MSGKYLTRQMVPKNWDVERKGTAYLISPSSGTVPLLVVLRDMLHIALNRKEVKKAIHKGDILLNQKKTRDEKIGLTLFDTITIIPLKKSYRLGFKKNGKFEMQEISEVEAKKKIAKIANKTKLKKGKIQINLNDGQNFFSDEKCKVNDSAVVDFKEKKIKKILPLKEKMNVIVFAGKHTGKTGDIEQIMEEKKMVRIKTKENSINVLIKQIMVLE